MIPKDLQRFFTSNLTSLIAFPPYDLLDDLAFCYFGGYRNDDQQRKAGDNILDCGRSTHGDESKEDDVDDKLTDHNCL